jgi:hypothetical protein
MTTPEQKISSGFYRRGLALAYLRRVAINTEPENDGFWKIHDLINEECKSLGIEPMSDSDSRTYESQSPGHPD